MPKIPINMSKGTLDKKDLVVGIDLGTTHSLVAFVENQKPYILKDTHQNELIPSVIHINKDGTVVVGSKAKEMLITHADSTLYSIKRLIGRSYKDVEDNLKFFAFKVLKGQKDELLNILINQKYYNPIELSAYILSHLKQRAQDILKTDIQKAVITVPAYFNDNQREATREAAKLAGLEVLRIINEPTAASLAYGIENFGDKEKKILVYDLGGGTFDVSILALSKGVFEVLATGGDTFLGGDDIDSAIVDYWHDKYPAVKKNQTSLNQQLRLIAEETKITLSQQQQSKTQFNGIALCLDKETFNNIIEKYIARTIDYCSDALNQAQLKPNEIDDIVLVGGSTRIPYIKKTLSSFFNKTPLALLNPDHVVALGASLHAASLSGKGKEVLLLDVTPLSIGIETLGGLMDIIIPRNTTIPTQQKRIYTTSKDGQVSIKLSVYQGEREMVKDNRQLASIDLKGIPPMPAGIPQLEVSFFIDADGILKMHAKELRSGVQQVLNLKKRYQLDSKEVLNIVKQSIKHGKEDIENRLLTESILKAQQLIVLVEKQIKNHAHLIDKKEAKLIESKLKDLKSSVVDKNKDKISHHFHQLNSATEPFANKLIKEKIENKISD